MKNGRELEAAGLPDSVFNNSTFILKTTVMSACFEGKPMDYASVLAENARIGKENARIEAPGSFDAKAAEHFGDIFADLELKRQRIDDRNMMIAGHARSLGYTLVTNNVREFSRVKGLKYEEWK